MTLRGRFARGITLRAAPFAWRSSPPTSHTGQAVRIGYIRADRRPRGARGRWL